MFKSSDNQTSTKTKVDSSSTPKKISVQISNFRTEQQRRREAIAAQKNLESAKKRGFVAAPKADIAKAKPKQKETPMAPATQHPLQAAVNQRLKKHRVTTPATKVSAAELKQREIEKALKTVQSQPEEKPKAIRPKFSVGRIILALSCAAASVVAIVALINLNMPDLPIYAAAQNAGIDVIKPSFIPYGYTMSDITSGNKKVTINFKNSVENASFSVIEEKSSWDSTALLNNFVKETYEDYSTITTNTGLKIYTSTNGATWAAWVNKGTVFKISINGGSISQNQLLSFITSF